VPGLFRLTLLVTLVSTVIGGGAVFFSLSLGPVLRRLDAPDAAAVAHAVYRAGARRNESALLLVGPGLLGAVASSEDRLRWSAWWLWAALGGWALVVLLRLSVVQPARRAALVVLGELAGSRSGGADHKRAQVATLVRRVQFATLLSCLAIVAAASCVAFGY
jgi:hypothetical protein